MKTITLNTGETAFVDDADFDLLNQHRWYRYESLSGTLYAQTSIRGRTLQMQHLVLKVPTGFRTDHKNGNGLDNQKSNLRQCTHAENSRNRKRHENNKSGFKGVCLDPRNSLNPWRAQIRVDGVRNNLGSHETRELAHKAYCDAAKRLHGEFARIA